MFSLDFEINLIHLTQKFDDALIFRNLVIINNDSGGVGISYSLISRPGEFPFKGPSHSLDF